MFYLVLAMFGSAAISLVLRAFGEQGGNRYGIILGNYITCVLVGLLMLPSPAQLLHGSPVTLVCGVIGGFFFVGGLVSMQSSIRVNGAGLTAAFAKLGLVVTLGVSVFFGERPDVAQLVGLVLVFAALALLHGEKPEGAGRRSFALLLLVLLTGGGGDAMSKIFERLGGEGEGALFFFWLFLTAGLLAAVLAYREYRHSGEKLAWKALAAGVLVGVPNYFSSYWLLRALYTLPALVVYPVASTGTILIVMALSALLFHEKPGKRRMLGLALILAALVFLNIVPEN